MAPGPVLMMHALFLDSTNSGLQSCELLFFKQNERKGKKDQLK